MHFQFVESTFVIDVPHHHISVVETYEVYKILKIGRCYTQILSPTCDEILNTYVFPKSQTWSGNMLWMSILHKKTLALLFPFS